MGLGVSCSLTPSENCGVKRKKTRQGKAAFPVNEEIYCKGAACSRQSSSNSWSCGSLKRGDFSLGQRGDRKAINTLKGMWLPRNANLRGRGEVGGAWMGFAAPLHAWSQLVPWLCPVPREGPCPSANSACVVLGEAPGVSCPQILGPHATQTFLLASCWQESR